MLISKIKQLNDINWIEIGYKEGDIIEIITAVDSTNTKDDNVTTSTVELKHSIKQY